MSGWKLRLGLAITLVAIVAMTLAISRRGNMPFDQAAWKAARIGWVGDSPRFRMRFAAMDAARKHSGGEGEIFGLFCEPDLIVDCMRSDVPTDPGTRYGYRLGTVGEPIRFWLPDGELMLMITVDQMGRRSDVSTYVWAS